MEMPLELGSGRDPVHDFLRDEVRLDGGDPVTLDAFHLIECLEQVQEGFPGRAAEVAGVHAC